MKTRSHTYSYIKKKALEYAKMDRRYMTGILPIRRKTLSNQSICKYGTVNSFEIKCIQKYVKEDNKLDLDLTIMKPKTYGRLIFRSRILQSNNY